LRKLKRCIAFGLIKAVEISFNEDTELQKDTREGMLRRCGPCCLLTRTVISSSSSSPGVTVTFPKAGLFSFNNPVGGLKKRKEFSESRIVGYSMEQMYNVVSDVEKYQHFLPWCQTSHLRRRKDNLVIADLVIGFPPLLESYTSTVTLAKPYLVRAESNDGRLFRQLITTWKFRPRLDKGKPSQSCFVDFYVAFEFRSVLTAQLANAFFNEVVRTMTSAFFNEARRRYGKESVPSLRIDSHYQKDDKS